MVKEKAASWQSSWIDFTFTSSDKDYYEWNGHEIDGKVQVVDNQRISVTQRQSVLDAAKLAEEGKSAKEIKDILEADKLDSGIYIMVDTLKYLKKGGRVTAAGAAIGTVLGIKPVLQIHGEKLDAFAKTRGVKQAKKKMIAAVRKD